MRRPDHSGLWRRTTYVQADASDGYRVIFSLPELDADFQDSEVIVADTMTTDPRVGSECCSQLQSSA